ncbi:MGMT family protein [Aridibaculum aurantiacum]|uniref:MGMT family protein n=1 Tax=Aridibaculum aurantiacum TaxID=2810307 RepID=UPI001A96BD3D|nr:MGMT family protein [Aridibaculum aurantiacum]
MKKKNDAGKLPIGDASRHYTFFENVWDVVRQIPAGRVTTYGAIAEYLGARSSARMVGWAMNQAHYVQPPVPAQRVVNRNGILSGKAHFSTPTLMQELLQQEGLQVENDTIVDFKIHLWLPVEEL